MVYLRHEYIQKWKNPNPEHIEEFAGIVHTTARIMYEKLYPNFHKVGFYEDDIVAITNIYMLSYMELYSVRTNQKLRSRFCKKYFNSHGREPTLQRLHNFDRNSMISFLRQRLVHLSTVCARKARNITVGKDRRGAFAFTEDSISASDEAILTNYKKYGYRKITKKELKEIKRRAKEKGDVELTDKYGFKVIEIELLNNGISHHDYKLMMESNDSLYSMNPEKVLMYNEEEKEMKVFQEKFRQMSEEDKINTLTQFIEDNKSKKNLKKEVKLARKMVKDRQIMV